MKENNRRRALGKGLEELFSNDLLSFDNIEETIVNEAKESDVVELDINELRPNPYQPRKVFDEEKLKELAESIKVHGVIQPIIVKRSTVKGYEIIAGERRVKASKIAGLKKIPAIIKDFNDQLMMEISLLENLQREDLNPIEEALAYQNLLNYLNLTQEELAKRLGKSRPHITNMIGILRLPEKVRVMLEEGKLSYSQARTISKLSSEEEMINLAEKSLENSLNTRDIEKKTQEIKNPERKKINAEYKALEEKLSDYFGTKVKIGKKKIEINYNNTPDLNRILEILNIGD